MKEIEFHKQNEGDVIFWIDTSAESKGLFLFSFDKKKVYNLFVDYPHNLTSEERAIFDEENPYWVSFFADNSK